MGTFIARADMKEVCAAARKQLKAQNFVVDEETNLSATTLFATGRFNYLWSDVTALIRLEPYKDVTLVDAKFQIGLLHRIAFVALLSYMQTIFILFALYIDEFAIAARDIIARGGAYLIGSVLGGISKNVIMELPKCYIILTGALIMAYLVFKLICKLDINGSTILTENETAFWDFLKKLFPLRLMAFAKLHLLSVNPAFCWNVSILAIGAILLSKMHPVVFFLAFPYLLYFCISILIPLFYEHSPILYPRALAVRNNIIITFLGSQIFLLMAAGFITSIIYELDQKYINSSTPISLATIRQCIEDRQSLIGTPISAAEAIQGFYKNAEYYTEKVVQKFPNSAGKENAIRKIFLLVKMLPIIVMFFGILLLAVLLCRQVAEFPTTWQNYAGKNDVDWVRLPAEVESKGVHNKSFQITILLVFIVGTALNALVLLVAVDSLWFILNGHTLFFAQTQTLLTWVLVPFLIADKFTSTQNPWFWSFLAKSIITIFGLLPLAIMLRRILVIWHNSFARFIHYTFDSFSGQQVPENLVLHIKSLCKKYAVKIPKIVKILKKTVCLSILPSYGVGKPIIFISDGAILKLTEAEIKAAIAHEIGHIKQGIWKFYMLRTIAIICGYPPWFLMLLIDLRGIEEDADKFALDVGEEPVALSQAIIKTSVPGYYSGQQMPSTLLVLCDRIRIIKPVLKACRLVLIIDSFLCTDELIGFSHPTPKDRIATIMAGTKVISDTA